MLDLLLGRAGTGKTRAVYERICSGGNRAILIVPEQFSHEAERELCRLGGAGICLRAEVLTFERIADTVLDNGRGCRYLDDGGRLLVLRMALGQISDRLRILGKKLAPGQLSALIRTIDELKSHMIADIDLQSAASDMAASSHRDKIEDLALILGTYNSIASLSASDPRDRLTRLSENPDLPAFFDGIEVYIDGFHDFTPQEYKILNIVIASSLKTTIALTYDPDSDGAGDQFELAADALRQLKYIADRQKSEIHVTSFRKSETPVSDALDYLERSIFEYEMPPLNADCNSISIFTAASRYEECEHAASIILDLTLNQGYRYRDIAVVARGFEAYERIITSIFESYGVPLFTDMTECITGSPVVVALLSAIDAVCSNFEYEDVFRFLKTGFAGITTAECDLLEKYVLAWNIKGSHWTRGKPWTWCPSGFSAKPSEADAELLERINRIRDSVRGSLSLLTGAKTAPVSRLVATVLEFISRLEFEKTLELRQEFLISIGDLRQVELNKQVWDILLQGLEQCAQVLGETRMQLREFSEILRLVLSQYKVGSIPVSLDRVIAGEADRTRRRRVSCVIVLGACDGALPCVQPASGVLTDSDRELMALYGIELTTGPDARMAREMAVIYSILSMPGQRLIMSFPMTAGSEAAQPSMIISRLLTVFPKLKIENPAIQSARIRAKSPCLELAGLAFTPARDEYAAASLEYFSSKPDCSAELQKFERANDVSRGPLTPGSLAELFGERVAVSSSKIDAYTQCRFKFFMEYGLSAKTDKQIKYDSLEHGKFLHFVLEQTIKEITQRGGAKNISLDDALSIAENAVSEYVSTRLGSLSDLTARFRHIFARLQKSVLKVVENVYAELVSSEFEPLAFEQYFISGTDGSPEGFGDPRLILKGVIDRVDGWEHDGKLYLRVVDYKSGKRAFKLDEIWHGLNLQLLIYLFALEGSSFGSNTVPAGALYIPTRDSIENASRDIDPAELADNQNKKLRRSGIVLDDSDVIGAMERNISGRARFLPVKYLKDGSVDANSSVASLERLGKLRRLVERRLSQLADALLGGDIEAHPGCGSSGVSVCRFCDFKQACHFDPTNGKDREHFLASISKKKVWELLDEGVFE